MRYHEFLLTHERCHHCGEIGLTEDMFKVNKYLSRDYTVELWFCNESCANQFYLERLREGL